MSRKPRTTFRPLDGLLLLDKPAGLSSNQALQRVRHLFRAAKGGHTGSLDPLATGLLPVCFGEATKIAGRLLGSRKAYEAGVRLGCTTDTDDADGQVLRERPVPDITTERLDQALTSLRGCIKQRAPIYSALKQGGEPLYAKARRGETVEAPEREVDVFALDVLEYDGTALRLNVECGSGTYVRSLVRDLGEALGCGAHVTALRRLWVEPFTTPTMHTFEALQAIAANGEAALDACLLPVEAGLAGMARVDIDAEGARCLAHGQGAHVADADEGEVAIFEPGGRCLGIGHAAGGVVMPRRLFRWAVAGTGGDTAS
ncbi:tRNA pseudouridine(55) synthase TruB [Lysobacter sp. SG-8]|uniref:tRNA pseudouridine synthase B n=1 Tax=Marilutibacter penaei TaxID=2759900 RepID=A0A7W3YDL2_9GAMM|nr:tRNA pseudouridine(55) synthase TruB [Lysobacter penaei]MBB1087498.1 tRNA pseudouridine(55) synthase TruB [Lysobacter penaei]